MKKYCFLAAMLAIGLTLTLAQIPDDSQKLPKVKREAIANCGQGTMFLSSCGQFSISQTIGQQSVIGYSTGFSYLVLQGYQQPFSFNHTEDTDISGILSVRCYPNPVTENLIISFNEITEYSIDIRIFDITGKLQNAYNYPSGHAITLNLASLPTGLYIIKILSGVKSFSTIITKVHYEKSNNDIDMVVGN